MRHSDTKHMQMQNLMNKVMAPLLIKQNTDYKKILWHWSSMLKENAIHIYPVRLIQNTLHVKSDSKGSLLLQFQKLMMIETINLFLGKASIKDIRSTPWLKTSQSKKTHAPFKPITVQNINVLDEISDPILKAALQDFLKY